MVNPSRITFGDRMVDDGWRIMGDAFGWWNEFKLSRQQDLQKPSAAAENPHIVVFIDDANVVQIRVGGIVDDVVDRSALTTRPVLA